MMKLDDYTDIIDLERPKSPNHTPMSPENRAAQFSPFAALTGLTEAMEDTAELHESKIINEEYKN